MLVVRKRQFEKLSSVLVKNFLYESSITVRNFFPEWAAGKKNDELVSLLESAYENCKKYKIFKKNNILKMIFFKLQFGFPLPPAKGLEKFLTDYKFDEDHRVENFYFAIASERYKLMPITITDDMIKMGRKTQVQEHKSPIKPNNVNSDSLIV